MESFAINLRRRAAELGLAYAEVARRAGLTDRRFGHYVTGVREPDFATLVRIAVVLDVTTDQLLLPQNEVPPLTESDALRARLAAAANVAALTDLEAAVVQLEAVIRWRTSPPRRANEQE